MRRDARRLVHVDEGADDFEKTVERRREIYRYHLFVKVRSPLGGSRALGRLTIERNRSTLLRTPPRAIARFRTLRASQRTQTSSAKPRSGCVENFASGPGSTSR